jgi:hypothetical protein
VRGGRLDQLSAADKESTGICVGGTPGRDSRTFVSSNLSKRFTMDGASVPGGEALEFFECVTTTKSSFHTVS